MTTEANNTTERKALNLVQRIVANRLENENGKIQENMKALGEDFTYHLGWKCEDIYKRHLLRNFYRDMLTQLAHPDTTEESAKEYLRHTVEHLADDILHGSPTRHSTNAIGNLAHTWEFDGKSDERGPQNPDLKWSGVSLVANESKIRFRRSFCRGLKNYC